jgi:hypothetical protein
VAKVIDGVRGLRDLKPDVSDGAPVVPSNATARWSATETDLDDLRVWRMSYTAYGARCGVSLE